MATIEKRILNNKVRFHVKVRMKGYPDANATFERLSDAKRWARETETSLRDGKYFKFNEGLDHTLEEAIHRYETTVLTYKRTCKLQKEQLSFWKKELGDYALQFITPALITEKRDKLAQGKTKRKAGKRTPATVNRYLAALSHVFTVAYKEWNWLNENPFLKVSRMKEPKGRIRFLSDDERVRLLEACQNSKNKMLYTLVVLCLSTGARKMEILGLRWSDIDFERRFIHLDSERTKNGEDRVLMLSNVAFNVLCAYAGNFIHSHDATNRHLVFPSGHDSSKPIDIRKPWDMALKAAKIDNFRFHDLRHSAASYLAMNGASLREIAEILGHKTITMSHRYAHLTVSHTGKVIESMNNKIFGNLNKVS